ncbi:E1 ubiquitin-activating protein uba2 [Dispira parvispora]|uniref:E1 ubiquitin-activating protein uba2 n=1 Tax=Dispira parvispora TaxID=1520584 RepID=A0A9W8AYN9_9FUNG|nr:E1 ubiquitin-activating protein uba2 [Dispira parvispora]
MTRTPPDSTTTQVKPPSSRVLMVGAGGIGCELLKNLVLCGFLNVDLVDLDTIDLSNLNRQFLFQKQHIGQPKAVVAAKAVRRFNSQAQVTAHHDNIKNPRFDVPWFRQFDLVLNALDNLEARRYVNRMCLIADRPLVESGTAGYLGQVTVIQRGRTECFDCHPKPTPQTFPICTIRSTPSAPIHCIVWAKDYLFNQLFGAVSQEDEEVESIGAIAAASTADNPSELEALHKENLSLKRLRGDMQSDDFAKRVFQKVFGDDINRLLTMDEMWATRQRPIPLNFDDYPQVLEDIEKCHAKDQQVWSVTECIVKFVTSSRHLAKRYQNIQSEESTGGSTMNRGLTFDKDDNDILDFVTATANLRSLVFHIEGKSRFDVKAMAGNIIPAIATTNAIIAGLITMQARHVLENRWDLCKTTYLAQGTTRPRLFYNETLARPSKNCGTCSVRYVEIAVDVARATLDDLLKLVRQHADVVQLGDDLGVEESGRLLYDPDFEDNTERTFADLQLTHGKLITVCAEEPLPNIWPLMFYIVEKSDVADPIQLVDPKQLAMPLYATKVSADATPTPKSTPATPATKRSASEPMEHQNVKAVKLNYDNGTLNQPIKNDESKVTATNVPSDSVITIEDDVSSTSQDIVIL